MNRFIVTVSRKRILLALTFALAVPALAALPPAEKLLPADTLLVFSVPDSAKLRVIYEKSAQARLWNDAAMKPFREKFLARWNEEFVGPLERDLGIKFDDYSALPQGQLTLAFTQNGWTGQPGNEAEPGVLFLLDAKEKSGQLKTNLADLRKKWTDAGKALKTEKIRDLEFSIVPLSSNDVPKTLKSFFPQKQEVAELGREETAKKTIPEDTLVIGQFESLLIIGNSTKVVEGVVAHLTGGNAPALADDPTFEANRLALFREAGFYAWLNTRSFVELLLKVPREKPNPLAPNPFVALPDVDKIVTALGLTGLKSAAFTFRETGDGSLFELFLGAPDASRQGIFKLLALDAKDAGPPPFVPADIVKFQRWRLDGPKTIANLEKLLKDLSPQLYKSWEFLIKNGEEAMKQGDPGYDLRKNIFANLGDDLITYEKTPRGTSAAELSSPPSLFAVASPQAEQLARAISGLLIIRSADALTPKTREFLGKKIYSIGMPSGPQQPPTSFSYAASGGYVVFSSDAATLEEFLRSAEAPGKPLRETPGLAGAAQRVGGQGTGLFNYENQAESMRLAFELFKKLTPPDGAASSNPLASALPFVGPEKTFREWMDFSLLPEFSKVSKYFYFTVWAGSSNTEGLSYKWFSPTPPAMK